MTRILTHDPTPEELEDVAVFPLPAVALFPDAKMPLHLFEPRYRALAADVLEGNGLVAMVQLAPGFEADYHGTPPLEPVAGLGRVMAHRDRPDGTYDILLRGVGRVALSSERLTETGYRRAEATPLVDGDLGSVTAGDRAALRALCGECLTRIRGLDPELELDIPLDAPIGALCDAAVDRLIADAETRQRALSALSLPRRVDLAVSAVGELLAELPGETATS